MVFLAIGEVLILKIIYDKTKLYIGENNLINHLPLPLSYKFVALREEFKSLNLKEEELEKAIDILKCKKDLMEEIDKVSDIGKMIPIYINLIIVIPF